MNIFKFTCELCNYKTNIKTNYTRHTNSLKHIRNGKSICHKCELCNYTTERPFNLKIHMKKHDPKRMYKFLCTACNYKAFDITNIRNHIKRESHKKKIIKKFNDKVFVHEEIDGIPIITKHIDLNKIYLLLSTMTMKIKNKPDLSGLTEFRKKRFDSYDFRTIQLFLSTIPFSIKIFSC